MGTRCTSMAEDADAKERARVKDQYFDILNNKNTTKDYVEDAGSQKREEKHIKKLNKVRAKELRKQQKKLKTGGRGLGDSDSDELPFWMQDASIRAAQAERAEEEAMAKKKRKRRIPTLTATLVAI